MINLALPATRLVPRLSKPRGSRCKSAFSLQLAFDEEFTATSKQRNARRITLIDAPQFLPDFRSPGIAISCPKMTYRGLAVGYLTEPHRARAVPGYRCARRSDFTGSVRIGEIDRGSGDGGGRSGEPASGIISQEIRRTA